MPAIAYLNGTFMPLGEATVPVEDRGFQFADGIYETCVARADRVFLLDEHLQRLRRSAAALSLAVDDLIDQLPAIFAEGVRRCATPDTLIYLQVTRGVASRDHVYDPDLAPTVVATFKPRPVYDPAIYREGVAVETVEEIRWRHCWIKSVSLLPAVMMKNAARQHGFHDAIILGPDGIARESTAANLCITTGSTLKTPALSDYILPGITRAFILQQAPQLGLETCECDLTVEDLYAADEMMLTSTTVNALPVTRIDGRTIGSGKPGPVCARLTDCFEAAL